MSGWRSDNWVTPGSVDAGDARSQMQPARHKEHPGTFEIPSKLSRYLLWKGRTVKLMFRIALEDEHGVQSEEVERMWVQVTRRAGLGQYVGVLDNDPSCTKGIAAGMEVVFEPRHVIQIY